MTNEFKPCPICGKQLGWDNVHLIDDEGYESSEECCEYITLSCDCGFMFTANALDCGYLPYESSNREKWQDVFLRKCNVRYNGGI